MAVLNMTDQLTALELAKRANNPDAFNIIELLRMTNEMLIDVPAYPANNGMINVTLQRNIAAMGEHRIYNQGVGKVATVTKPVHDRIAILAAYSDVDKAMADNSGNVSAVRNSEAIPIVKGMGLTQAETLIYGDESKPEEFAGLMSRRNSLSDSNVIDASTAGGTSTDFTSVYLVSVGKDLFHLIYPEKSGYGIGVRRTDRGYLDVKDSRDASKEYPVYREYFEAMYGLSIRAPDAVKRICNIRADITPAALLDVIIDTRYKLPPGASTYAMYGNVNILIKLDKAARDKDNVAYTAADPWGQPITHVRDVRVRRMDVVLSTEAAVA